MEDETIALAARCACVLLLAGHKSLDKNILKEDLLQLLDKTTLPEYDQGLIEAMYTNEDEMYNFGFTQPVYDAVYEDFRTILYARFRDGMAVAAHKLWFARWRGWMQDYGNYINKSAFAEKAGLTSSQFSHLLSHASDTAETPERAAALHEALKSTLNEMLFYLDDPTKEDESLTQEN